MTEKIRIVTLQGDYDVLVGKKWVRGFNRLWKARLYKVWLELKRGRIWLR